MEALVELRDRLTLTRERVGKYAKIENVAVDLGGEQAEKTLQALDIVQGQKQRWVEAEQKIKADEAEAQATQVELTALEAEVQTTLADMGQCPVCGSKVKHGAHT